MPKVNPHILTFARETAGLSLEDAAKKLGLSSGERLLSLEKGEREPSRRQLSNMADKYRRPLLTFYLSKAPELADKGQDFRVLPDVPVPGSEALVDALLRNVQARQGLVRSALEEAEEDKVLSFVGSTSIRDGVEAVVASMSEVLSFDADDFHAEKSVDEAFSALRSATERAGVFVLLMGNLGTHHTDISPEVFRGFSLADEVAPFVVINEKDSRAAWSFTLIHELAHIWLGQTGVSGYSSEVEIERFCDSVAAKYLLDPMDLTEVGAHIANGLDDLKDRIGIFAEEQNLSRKMIAYNLLRVGLIGGRTYQSLSDVFDQERLAERRDRSKGSGAPDYYVVRRHRVGPKLVRVVKRLVDGGVLSSTKAGKVLGVKPTAVGRLMDSGISAGGR